MTLRVPAAGSLMQTRALFEFAALHRSEIFRQPPRRGEGQPIVLFPGFGMSQASLSTMARWLHVGGYAPKVSEIAPNVGCSQVVSDRAERRVDAIVTGAGTKATLIGHSRGGQVARVLAARRPDLVAGVVTLGTPGTRSGLDATLMLTARALILRRGLGIRAFPTGACFAGTGCCLPFTAALQRPPGSSVPVVSLWSQSDGIVPPTSRLRTGGERCELEVDASHLGLTANEQVYRAIASMLPSLVGPPAPVARALRAA